MSKPSVSFTAAGDYLGQRRIPVEDKGFAAVSSYIKKGDVRLFNLETTLAEPHRWANQFCGGSYLRIDASLLDDAKAYGFNYCSFTNNHAFDYGLDGMLDTMSYVKKAGFVTSGAGMNLGEASAPGYVDLPGARVAVFSITVSFGGTDNAAAAGPQSRRTVGRPGVNLLHMSPTLYCSAEDFAAVKRISESSGINAELDVARAEGYLRKMPEDTISLDNLPVKLGEKTEYVVSPDPNDMARMEKEIYNAGMFADYIFVMIHSHQLCGRTKETPGHMLETFARRCIDAGAHAVIASGPHLLRPIEIYKGYPIFYSLGDFVLHNENIAYAPEEMFQRCGMTSDDNLRDLFARRSANYTRGLMSDHRMHESVLPFARYEDGKLAELTLMPIELDFAEPRYRRGNPHFCPDGGILEYLADMSTAYGTTITKTDDGFGIVDI